MNAPTAAADVRRPSGALDIGHVFQVLACDRRRAAFEMIARTGSIGATFSEVAEVIGRSQPTASHHIAALIAAGLVDDVGRVGDRRYHAGAHATARVREWLLIVGE
jgi:DNA-binding transcriptional ArsR family regulator